VEGIEPSQPTLETGGVTVRYTRMCRSGKLKTARLGSFPGGRLWLLGLGGFYQLAAHRSCPLLPRAGVIGEKDMHACLSSRSYRAVQSFTGLPFDALLDSRVATGPREGNTIYVCLMPATVARAASAFGSPATCWWIDAQRSVKEQGAQVPYCGRAVSQQCDLAATRRSCRVRRALPGCSPAVGFTPAR
jgi:hypothetical protein